MNMTKYFGAIVALLTLLSCAGDIKAQVCGGSIRTIRLEYSDGEKEARRTVNYELFYLMPKDDDGHDWRKQDAFISDFLNGDVAVKGPVWLTYNHAESFFQVPKKKAETYIAAYRLENFKAIYTDDWREHGPPQLKGSFAHGLLRLRTRETDRTTFIMKVTSPGYETQYLLSNFLGGCHKMFDSRKPSGEKILMKRAKP